MIYLSALNPSIKCESKRSFYSDERNVEAAVGTPTEPKLPGFVQDELTVESFLEDKIKLGREQLFKYLELSKKVYIDQSDKYFKAEREVSSTVSSLHDKREEYFPNALYVLTGGLFGSVLARNRNILLRIASPLACGLVSLKFFFPLTFANIFGYLDNAQKENLPDIYNKQTQLINQAEDLVKKTADTAESSSKEVSTFFSKAKKSFGDFTGLNVDQTITSKKDQ